jgi:hypothetical protein
MLEMKMEIQAEPERRSQPRYQRTVAAMHSAGRPRRTDNQSAGIPKPEGLSRFRLSPFL